MGTSTDAILFYGIHADEGEWDEYIRSDWETAMAKKMGVTEPTVAFSDRHQEVYRKYWAAKAEILKGFQVDFGTHCSGECPMPYMYVKESRLVASRGYPQEVLNQHLRTGGQVWDAQIKAMCELLGMPYVQPRWWLVSDWS